MHLAIIPARGGSKRIPRKNIKNFCGKPIISYAIEAVKNSKMFSNIVVSTDDLEIKEISLELGAKVPFMRPKDLSDDFIETQPVIKHAIKECLKREFIFDSVCCIYPCVPLITSNDIKKAFEIHKKNQYKYCFPIVEFSPPIQQAFEFNERNHNLSLVSPGFELERTQDLKKTFFDAGQFYWGRKDLWLNKKNMMATGVGLVLPRWRILDIDNLEDWKRAELMYRTIHNTIS